ncbi:MAG: DsbA family protein [Pseudobdellovibrio sp.]
MKNKMFLIGVLILAAAIFVGATIWNKKQVIDNPRLAEKPKADLQILIRDHSPIKGNRDASVVIVEFLDPECEACRAMHPIVKQLLSEYEGKVQLVIRYMPFHGNSKFAAAALEEARERGKYDEALDILFEKQPEWADHGQPRPDLIPIILSKLGIEKGNLETNKVLAKHAWKIDLDQVDGNKVGVRHTPTFFVNGEMLDDIGYEPLKAAIDKYLAK